MGGGSSGYGYQCVDLAHRLYNHLGWGTVRAGGDGGARNIDGSSHEWLQGKPNDGTYTPKPGDLIVEGATGGNPWGHVAVVSTVESNVITAVEQNASASGYHIYTVGADGVVSGGYGTVLRFVTSIKNTALAPEAPTSSRRSGSNLLVNGSFEDGWSGWSERNDGAGDITAPARSRPYDGRVSMRVDGVEGQSRVLQVARVDGAEGDSFVAEVMVRSDAGEQPGALAVWATGGGDPVSVRRSFVATPEWQPVRLTLTLDADHSAITFNLVAPDGSRIYMDAASLQRSLLVNGSFEDGWSGWSERNDGAGDITAPARSRPYDGRVSMRVDGVEGQSRVLQVARVDGAEGDSFVAEVMVRSDAGEQPGALAVWATGGGDPVSVRRSFVATPEWQPVRLTLTLDADHSAITFNLVAPDGSRIYMDAASLQRSLLVNGSFEDGWSGWSERNDGAGDITAPARSRPYDGRVSMRVDGVEGQSRVLQVARVDGAEGDSFVAEVMVRSDAGEQPGALAVWATGGGDPVSVRRSFVATPEWQPVRLTLTLDADHSAITFNLVAPDGSRIYMDAASLG